MTRRAARRQQLLAHAGDATLDAAQRHALALFAQLPVRCACVARARTRALQLNGGATQCATTGDEQLLARALVDGNDAGAADERATATFVALYGALAAHRQRLADSSLVKPTLASQSTPPQQQQPSAARRSSTLGARSAVSSSRRAPRATRIVRGR